MFNNIYNMHQSQEKALEDHEGYCTIIRRKWPVLHIDRRISLKKWHNFPVDQENVREIRKGKVNSKEEIRLAPTTAHIVSLFPFFIFQNMLCVWGGRGGGRT